MNQISTTIEQSDRLIACGVDPATADMCWTQRTHRIDGTPIKKSHQKANLWLGYPSRRVLEDYEQRIDTPAWSLSILLAMIPSSLQSPYGTQYRFELSKLRMHDEWEAQWFSGHDRFIPRDKNNNYHRLWDKSPIEACVKAIEWLTSNGYTLEEANKAKATIRCAISDLKRLRDTLSTEYETDE